MQSSAVKKCESVTLVNSSTKRHRMYHCTKVANTIQSTAHYYTVFSKRGILNINPPLPRRYSQSDVSKRHRQATQDVRPIQSTLHYYSVFSKRGILNINPHYHGGILKATLAKDIYRLHRMYGQYSLHCFTTTIQCIGCSRSYYTQL